MAEVQAADPRARRQAAWFLALGTVVVVVCGLAFVHYRPELEAWILADPAQMGRRLRIALAGLALQTSGPLAACAVYLWALGRRVARAGRFPPPGMSVLRNTPVLVGPGARLRATLLEGLAVVLVVVAVLLALLLWSLVRFAEAGAGAH
jgi:hypothetical protein